MSFVGEPSERATPFDFLMFGHFCMTIALTAYLWLFSNFITCIYLQCIHFDHLKL